MKPDYYLAQQLPICRVLIFQVLGVSYEWQARTFLCKPKRISILKRRGAAFFPAFLMKKCFLSPEKKKKKKIGAVSSCLLLLWIIMLCVYHTTQR